MAGWQVKSSGAVRCYTVVRMLPTSRCGILYLQLLTVLPGCFCFWDLCLRSLRCYYCLYSVIRGLNQPSRVLSPFHCSYMGAVVCVCVCVCVYVCVCACVCMCVCGSGGESGYLLAVLLTSVVLCVPPQWRFVCTDTRVRCNTTIGQRKHVDPMYPSADERRHHPHPAMCERQTEVPPAGL